MSRTAVAMRADSALLRAMPWVFVLIWSTGFIVARMGMPHSPPFKFLTMRFGFSVLCFVVWIAVARVPWPKTRSQWMHLAVVGVLMQAGYLGGVWAAVKEGLGAGTAALLVGLQPVLTAAWLGIGARSNASSANVSTKQWLGLVLGFAGLVLVVWDKLGAGEITTFNLCSAIVALLSITAGTLYQKRFLQQTDVRTASTVQLIAAFVVTLPLAWWEREAIDVQPAFIGAMAWSVVGLTLGGSSLLFLLLQRGAATSVTSLLYLVPPCTAVMAWIIFGEALTPHMLAGMAMTAIGVAMVVRSPA